MIKAEKLEVAQNFIDGMNSLTIRFCPYGIGADGKYIKKPAGERYYTGEEIKEVKKIHDRINEGMKTKKDENGNDYSEFDGSTKAKPLKTKAKEKLALEIDDSDLSDIVDLYFLEDNKDKVGDKAKEVK